MNPVIDFSWFYFIGSAKLGLTMKQTGRLTMWYFFRLYEHYKRNWGLEMRLTKANMTYEDLYRKQQEDEEWF